MPLCCQPPQRVATCPGSWDGRAGTGEPCSHPTGKHPHGPSGAAHEGEACLWRFTHWLRTAGVQTSRAPTTAIMQKIRKDQASSEFPDSSVFVIIVPSHSSFLSLFCLLLLFPSPLLSLLIHLFKRHSSVSAASRQRGLRLSPGFPFNIWLIHLKWPLLEV